MFIVHGAWFRRNMRWLLAIVLALLIPSFIALYTNVDSGRGGRETKLPTIGGQTVSQAEYDNTRNIVVAEMLLNSGGQLPQTERFSEQLQQETLVRLLILREAGKLGIRATDEDLIAHIRRQPFLQNQQGQFDPVRYQNLLATLNASRINQDQFGEVMRHQLIMDRLQALVTTTVKVTPLQVRQTFQAINANIIVEYVTIEPTDDLSGITVSDDDVAGYFAQNQETYRTERRVKVRYVLAAIAAATAPVSDADVAVFYERSGGRFTNSLAEASAEIREEMARTRAVSAAGDRATELTVKLVPERGAARASFPEAAEAAGLTVQETGFFGLADEIPGLTDGDAFRQAAFALRPEAPISDPIEGPDGFYVLELVDEQPSVIPPLGAVKDQVVADLKRERAFQQALEHGAETATKIQAAVAEGKSFAAACTALQLKPATSAPFSLSDETADPPGAGVIKETALGMSAGAVSGFLRTATGGVIFSLQDRTEPTDEEFEKDKLRMARLLEQQQRTLLWQSWLRDLVSREQVSL